MKPRPLPPPETPDQAGYLELIRGNRNFRWLWIGSIISQLGDWFNTIALYSLVAELTGSPFALGAVLITKTLPFALASPLAGLIADRFNRRRLMIGTDIGRAVIVLGFLVVDDPSEVPLLYILTALQVMLGAVFIPARRASIPNITTPRELLTANTILSATWSMMLALGAALGGFATAWLGTQMVFLIDSVTYLVSAVFIFGTVIPQYTAPFERTALFRRATADVVDGWRHMIRHPRIGRIALVKSTWSLGGGALVFMLTLLGEYLTPTNIGIGIGLLFCVRGIGTGVGPLAAQAWLKNERTWPVFFGWGIAMSGLCFAVVGLQFPTWAFGVAILIFLAHSMSGANWVLSTVLLQKRTEDAYRGRVFASEWLLVTLLNSAGTLVASLLLEGELISLQAGFILFGGVQVLCGLGLYLWIVPQEKRDAPD